MISSINFLRVTVRFHRWHAKDSVYLVEHERNEPCRFIFVCLFSIPTTQTKKNDEVKSKASWSFDQPDGENERAEDPRISRFDENSSVDVWLKRKKIPEYNISQSLEYACRRFHGSQTNGNIRRRCTIITNVAIQNIVVLLSV